jgi:hypothetical protein
MRDKHNFNETIRCMAIDYRTMFNIQCDSSGFRLALEKTKQQALTQLAYDVCLDREKV